MGRQRLRDLGITVGVLPTGSHNAITDVADVWVGHATVVHDSPRVARTGVTVILPRAGNVWNDHCCAGYHAFNGNGEMTGMHWIREAGMLTTPVAITTLAGAAGAGLAILVLLRPAPCLQSYTVPFDTRFS